MSLSVSQQSRLHYQHRALEEITAFASAEEISRTGPDGKWGILENIAHLVCYQVVFIQRIEKMVREVNPQLSRYVAEQDPTFETVRKCAKRDLVRKLEEKRQEIIHLLSSLTETELDRSGVHPVYGKMDIPDWVEMFLLHEAHHLMTIFYLTHVNDVK